MLSTATTNTLTLTNPTRIDKYIMRKDEVKYHLMNNTLLSVLTLSLPQNISYIQRYQELYNSIIPIHSFEPKKLEVPVIPKIQIESTDTNEIKKMIRKLNIETQSFTCNHLTYDRKYDSFEADIGKVYLMQEKKDVDDFMNRIISVVMSIEDKDRRGNDAYTLSEEITLSDIKKINDKIIAINNKLIEIESFFKSLKCHKCEHIMKKYLIVKETIEEMRQELREERELAEALNNEVAEDKYSVDTFMKKHYPSIERVLLKDICNKYKEVFGIHKTLLQMREELEPLGFKITCCKRIYYVSRK